MIFAASDKLCLGLQIGIEIAIHGMKSGSSDRLECVTFVDAAML